VFESFFPKPKPFFLSALLWTACVVAFWYTIGDSVAEAIGFQFSPPGSAPIIGLGYFVTPEFMWFYLVFSVATAMFAGFWAWYAPHPWQTWSVLGSALIIFTTYFSVQISVALNNWRRPFFDLFQTALSGEGDVQEADFYILILQFAQIAFLSMAIFVAVRFFVSHYIFRWRQAMNDFYMSFWTRVRHIEGASQRVQEDTMRFAAIMEGLGVALIDAIMTLFAFLPVLWVLSDYITEVPLLGQIPKPLFTALLFWSIFGTVLLAAVGIKLPGLEFKNQRVEAAYRKELVYGEDHAERAQPPTVRELFNNVRRNYFRLYFHYMYFNIARGFYIQADAIYLNIILVPTVVAGAITLGIWQQILTAFGQVSSSFQFLINSWTTIVELLSIHKRLAAFEAAIFGGKLPSIDEKYLAEHGPNPAAEPPAPLTPSA
jgi:peptide/bleomycin uptake transporter